MNAQWEEESICTENLMTEKIRILSGNKTHVDLAGTAVKTILGNQNLKRLTY